MPTSYTLYYSDPTNTGTIEVLGTSVGPGKNNYDTSLDLVGPGYLNYGHDTAQNFVKLLENFAGPNPPTNAIKGQLWFDTSNPVKPVLRINNGSITSNRWPAASGIYQQTVDPDATYTSNVKVGDIWVDTRANQLKIRNSSNEWVTVGPTLDTGANKTGPEVSIIESNTGSFYPAILNWTNGKIVEILTYNNFTPKTVIDGFNTLEPGSNLTSRVSAKYNGIAKSATELYLGPGSSIAANAVLKNKSLTTPQVHTGTFIVESSGGFQVKNPVNQEQVRIYNTTTEAFIEYSDISSSALRIGLGTGTESVSFLRFTSSGNLGVNNMAPTATLDITGSGKFSKEVVISTTTNATIAGDGALSVLGGAYFGKSLFANTLTVAAETTLKDGILLGITGGSGPILTPENDDSYDIGSATNSFRDIYVSNIRSGSGYINIYGSVSTATQLENAQEITIEGQLTTTAPAVFDGTAPSVIFVEANSSIITGTTTATVTSSTQNLLICDTETPDTLAHISKADFLSDVYSLIFQTGMIVPYTTSSFASGSSLADNFLFCDGTEVSRIDEAPLWNIVGDKYGSISPETFTLPDLTNVTTSTTNGHQIYYIIKR